MKLVKILKKIKTSKFGSRMINLKAIKRNNSNP